MATEAEIAWAAGLFEGEGWAGRNGTTVSLSVNMTDRDVLDRFAVVVGGGNVTGPYDRGARRKPMHQWIAGERETVRRIFALFLPWMGERRSARLRELMPDILPPRQTSPDCGWTGSPSWGVTRHTRKGEPPCAPCRERNAEASRRVRRGDLIGPFRQRPDPGACMYGHPLVGRNAMSFPSKPNFIACRTCQQAAGRAYRRRHPRFRLQAAPPTVPTEADHA